MARICKSLIGASALALLAGGASAAHLTNIQFATSVQASPSGEQANVQCNTASRMDICNTLGAPDGDFAGGVGNGFFSTANAGSLTFSFGSDFTGPVYVFEVTGGNVARNVEGLDLVFMGTTAAGLEVKGILNTQGTKVEGTMSRYEISFDLEGGPFRSVTVYNNSGTEDGFDLDAIGVSPVPLPAAGFMLLAGLGGLAAARRRRG